MRCPSCDWTSVSYVVETRQWSCKRCHYVFSDSSASSGRKTGSAASAATAKPAAGRATAPKRGKKTAKGGKKSAGKTTRRR